MATRVNLAEVVPLRAFDDNGDPVSGAKLRVYEAGTTTEVSLTSDLAGTTAVIQPVVADSEGYFVSTDSLDALYIAPQAIKYTIEDSADVELVSQDNLFATSGVVRVEQGADDDSYIVSDIGPVIKTVISGTERFEVNATGVQINSGVTITGVSSQAEAEAGTSTDTLMTPQRVDQHLDARADAPNFTSAAQTFAAATSTSLAHGLGAAPSKIRVIYECITTDRGYAVGDRVSFGESHYNVTSSSTFGHIIRTDATNVTIAYGSGGLTLPNASSGIEQTLTAANWEIYVEAWR